MRLPVQLRARDLPEVGACVPGLVVRGLVGVVGALLSLLCYDEPLLVIVGIALAGAAAVIPERLAAWALLLVLGASQLPDDSTPLDAEFLILLAGLHLLHVLAAFTLRLPPQAWVQLDVLRQPLLRFIAIQIPVQLIAVGALTWLARGGSDQEFTLPLAGVAGVVALAVVAGLLAMPLLRERPR